MERIYLGNTAWLHTQQAPSRFPPLNVMRDTACNSHNLQCVICDPVIVLLLMWRTFDKVKVIFCRSQYSVGTNAVACVAADHFTFSQSGLDLRCILDCICRRSSAVFWWRQVKPVMFIFENCLKSLLALRYCNAPQCLHSRCMHDRNSIIIGVDCFWHVLVADSCFVLWSDFIFNTSKSWNTSHSAKDW